MNITIFKAHSWQFYYSYKERWQLAQECLFMRSLFIYSKIVSHLKIILHGGLIELIPRPFACKASTLTTELHLLPTYYCCYLTFILHAKYKIIQGNLSLNHTMSYLLKLVYATMSLTGSFLEIKWIKYSGEIFTHVLLQIMYLEKLSANQLIPQMLCDRNTKCYSLDS